MSSTEIILAQITDPFRIGLLVALIATMLRTRDRTGTLIPLLAGAVFVAVIIPMTLVQSQGQAMWSAVLHGIVANAILLALMMGAWTLWERRKR